MAKIREYNAQGGIEVSGAGARSIAQGAEYAGREVASVNLQPAIRNFGEMVIDYRDKFVVAPELNKGAAAFALLQDKLTTEWNERVKNTDPNDPTIRQKFNEEVFEPEMETFRGAFATGEGQKFADSQVNNFRLHMTQKTQADMSLRAGLALKKNLDIMANSATNTIMNDPSSFEATVKSLELSVRAQVRASHLDAKTSAQVETELLEKYRGEYAKAAIIGMAQRNPDAAEQAIASGRFNEYVNAAEAKTLLTYARTQRSAQRTDAERELKITEKVKKQISDDAENEWLKKFYPEDGSMPNVKAQDVLNDPRLLTSTKKTLLNTLRRELKPETDAQVSRFHSAQFFQRIILPDGDPNKLSTTEEVDNAYGQEQLTRTDYQFLRTEILNRKTAEGQAFSNTQAAFLNGMKTQITKSNPVQGTLDQDGDKKFYEFGQFVQSKVKEMRQKKIDPLELFNPKSPHYLGDDQTLAPWRTSLEQSIINGTNRLGNNVKPKDDTRIELPQGILPIPQETQDKYPGVMRMNRDKPELKLKKNDLVYPQEVNEGGVKMKKWFKVPE